MKYKRGKQKHQREF